MAHIIGYVLFLIYMTPIVLIILFSFTESVAIKTGVLGWDTFTLEHYQRLFTQSNAFKPYLVSIVYSLLAAVLAAIVSIIVARIVTKAKGKVDSLFEYSILIPWLLPSSLIALGLMQTYDVPRWVIGNQVLIGTVILLLIAYVTVKLPFTFRMVKAAFFSIDDNLEEAAKCMGSGTLYTMIKVILPVILPAVISVVVLNFNSLLSDYDLTVFLYHPIFQPLGIVIKSASDEMATSDAQAMAFVYSVVLMFIASGALYFTQGDGLQRFKQRRRRKLSAMIEKSK